MDVLVVDHPLAKSRLSTMRDARTDNATFRAALRDLTLMLVYEALRGAPLRTASIHTPVARTLCYSLSQPPLLVPVLRAGLGMLDAVLELVPRARVGHIGLQRDEMTAVASQYYSKLPKALDKSFVLMLDPMLATGGSAVAALDLLRAAGARNVRIVCIVAAPEGLSVVERHHPGVVVYTPVVDRGLNEHKFIVPGLGDFGDRLYGTV